MRTAFVPTITKLLLTQFNAERISLTHRYYTLCDSELIGCYGDRDYFNMIGAEILHGLYTNNTTFNPLIANLILTSIKSDWVPNFNYSTTVKDSYTDSSLYDLLRVTMKPDNAQFLDLNLSFIVLGEYNKVSKYSIMSTLYLDKLSEHRLITSTNNKNDLQLDTCRVVNWCNKLHLVYQEIGYHWSFRKYLVEQLNHRASTAMFIVVLLLSRGAPSVLTTCAKQILQQLETHFTINSKQL